MAKFDFKKASMKAVGLGAGATAAVMVDRLPFLSSLNPKMRAMAKIGIGVMLPAFVKNDMIGHVGDGMIAVGTNQLVASFTPAVQGIGEVYGDEGVYGDEDVNGIDEDVNINGMDDATINGDDEY
jgi:hypothetical protein